MATQKARRATPSCCRPGKKVPLHQAVRSLDHGVSHRYDASYGYNESRRAADMDSLVLLCVLYRPYPLGGSFRGAGHPTRSRALDRVHEAPRNREGCLAASVDRRTRRNRGCARPSDPASLRRAGGRRKTHRARDPTSREEGMAHRHGDRIRGAHGPCVRHLHNSSRVRFPSSRYVR
jgi:hypothetical protein